MISGFHHLEVAPSWAKWLTASFSFLFSILEIIKIIQVEYGLFPEQDTDKEAPGMQ